MAIHNNLAYVTNELSGDYAIYVFNHANTDDGDRAALTRKFSENRTVHSDAYVRGKIAVFEDELYVIWTQSTTVYHSFAFDRNSTNGVGITVLRDLNLSFQSNSRPGGGVSATEHSLFVQQTNSPHTASYDREGSGAQDYRFAGGSTRGLSAIGDTFYSITNLNEIIVYKRDPDDLSDSVEIKTIQLPSGLTTPIGLDIPSARD